MSQIPIADAVPPALVERLTHPAILEQLLAGLDARLVPTDRLGLHRRASLLRGLGRQAEATATYRALLALDPGDLAAKAGMAILVGEPLPADASGPAPFVHLHNMLSAEQQQDLWRVLEEQKAGLQPAGVYEGGAIPRVDEAKRIAQRLDQAGMVRAWFLPWLEDLMARTDILPRLGLAGFAVGRRELQVTGHGHGGFFNIHKDASADPASPSWARHVTFIYYFHREPRRFTGGDLLLFDASGKVQSGGDDFSFTRIDPTHNSLVFFESNRFHTVTRIDCPSADLLDGRWTVNGWLHRN
ncbi:2OG-Fe(II) oxygenase [Ferrovibrio sp.]|uniref:2OG-Fe(II) oxygenase n=1 Tax=Ferrovibrio sp. TaxID=1917215 RepID=UPI003D0D0B80